MDTQNITVVTTPTKGSRIYTEVEYTYSAKGVNLDKLNTLANVAFQNKRFEISLSNDILTIKKNAKKLSENEYEQIQFQTKNIRYQKGTPDGIVITAPIIKHISRTYDKGKVDGKNVFPLEFSDW